MVLVAPPETVVPNKLVVRHNEASAGVQSAGLGGGPILPSENTLDTASQITVTL